MKLAMVGAVSGDERIDCGRYDVMALAEALARHGHEVRVLTAAAPKTPLPAPEGVVVERLPVDTTGMTRPEDLIPLIGDMGHHLVETFDGTAPDVVHCQGWAYGMAAQLAAKRRPVATVQAFAGLSATARRRRGNVGQPATTVKIESLLARNATAVTVACHDDMQEVIRLGCPRARVAVLPPGIEVDEVPAEEIVSRGAEPSRRIVAVARDFTPQQGLGQMVRVLPSVGAAELVLVATDAAEGPHAGQIIDMARTLKVDTRVRLHAGATGDELTALFRTADVVVAPALYEPSCDAVLQAMACGAAIVAPAAGGVRDAVIADVTGLLVPPGRLDALARALRSILGQMVLRQGMGLAGRSRARSRYSWDRIATDAEVVYDSARNRKPVNVH
ncbi:glycosyltransferase family 4 protein [Mycobacterium sp. 4D054]|uniref:glycosyltransferase family 4 protein n=1 Tax=Mycobacterium sp. 4D054 TaxID=3457440 RepID=UPI003FD5C4CA